MELIKNVLKEVPQVGINPILQLFKISLLREVSLLVNKSFLNAKDFLLLGVYGDSLLTGTGIGSFNYIIFF